MPLLRSFFVFAFLLIEGLAQASIYAEFTTNQKDAANQPRKFRVLLDPVNAPLAVTHFSLLAGKPDDTWEAAPGAALPIVVPGGFTTMLLGSILSQLRSQVPFPHDKLLINKRQNFFPPLLFSCLIGSQMYLDTIPLRRASFTPSSAGFVVIVSTCERARICVSRGGCTSAYSATIVGVSCADARN